MSIRGKDDLAAKLMASAAVAALSHERRVASIVSGESWAVSHGVYYVDGETGKRREIDVIGTRRWVVGSTVGIVKLVIECKSASEWNVVFVPSQGPTRPCALQYWSINDHVVARDIVGQLASIGLGEDVAEDVRKALFKALDRHEPRRDMIPVPPAVEPLVSGFVETNIGQTKDPEAAVTWKAVQALTSAIGSFRTLETVDRARDVASAARLGLVQPRHPDEEITKTLSVLADFCEYYHPIVVTQSPLWLLADTVEELPWCRYELTDKSHGRMGWYDVVHADRFAEYLAHLTSTYDNQMLGAGARLEP